MLRCAEAATFLEGGNEIVPLHVCAQSVRLTPGMAPDAWQAVQVRNCLSQLPGALRVFIVWC